MGMDPMMIFGNYTSWKLDAHTWVIQFMNGSQYMYLLEGEKKALLIDTGYGAGNLRAYAERLTDKPLLVANTHFHPDHAGGNGEFEKVYVSKGWIIDAPSVTAAGATPFELNKLPYTDYEKCVVTTGDEIELGNRAIEVLEAKPAHCNSSLFFLDRSHKMLFVGDEFEAAQVLLFDNSKNPAVQYEVKERLDNFAQNAKMLLELSDCYTYVLPNHNGTPIAKEYIGEYEQLVEAVYQGNAIICDRLDHPFIELDPNAASLCRVRWKNASIFIKKDLLMRVYGKKQ